MIVRLLCYDVLGEYHVALEQDPQERSVRGTKTAVKLDMQLPVFNWEPSLGDLLYEVGKALLELDFVGMARAATLAEEGMRDAEKAPF